MNIINNISIGIASAGTIVAGWLGYIPNNYETKFGASTQSSEVRALFTTTLASKITSSATSMTLTSATDKDGTTLASSTYGFIIDEGTSKEELVLADCTGTTCTNMTRGLSVRTGTTTVAALQFEHGRGAEVKITDAPALIYASNVFRGKQNLDYKLRYDSAQTFNNSNDIISRSYADSLSFGAVPASSETASGFVELSTGIETASSTSSGGTGARLAIPASLATSSYNSATAALRVVVTQNSGKIDSNFIDTTSFPSLSGNNTYTGRNIFSTSTATSTLVGSMPAYWIGKNIQVFSTPGTTTFSVPSGINKISVRVVGGGGGGSGVNSVNSSGGGGGGGGYAEEMIDVTGTSTIQVYVGNGGSGGSTSSGNSGDWSTFGTNGYYLYAQGGSPGSGATGGGGGCGFNADLNSCGGGGGGGVSTAAGPSGAGGSNSLGGGGNSVAGQSGGPSGKNYGGGGAGGSESGSSSSGGNGAQGVVIVTW